MIESGKDKMGEPVLWESLDDASIGAELKRYLSDFAEASSKLDRPIMYSAALMLCCLAHEANAGKSQFTLEGISSKGQEIGDWKVTIERLG